ncbi:MAG: hypothetical protein JXR03_15000 [Cyclobacteriaceae bacterium]
MRKFKIFFYPIYIIFALVILYFSIDIMINLDTYKEKIPMNMIFRDIPMYLLSLFLFVSLMMLVGIIVENSHIVSLKKKLSNAEKEVLTLKAKLYDRSQLPEESTPDLDEDVEEDDSEESAV